MLEHNAYHLGKSRGLLGIHELLNQAQVRVVRANSKPVTTSPADLEMLVPSGSSTVASPCSATTPGPPRRAALEPSTQLKRTRYQGILIR